MKRVVALVAVLIGGFMLTACDPAFEDIPGSWDCSVPTTVYYIEGDFTAGQIQDIHGAFDEWKTWSGSPLVWGGATKVRWEMGTPKNSITVEKKYARGMSGVTGIGAFPGDPYWYSASVYMDPSLDNLVSPTEASAQSGMVWRGFIVHELGHATVGLGDMYDNPEGNHPGLIMGSAYYNSNTMMLGDMLGAVETGCRTPADKASLKAQLMQFAGNPVGTTTTTKGAVR
jgi:hypothetical protein